MPSSIPLTWRSLIIFRALLTTAPDAFAVSAKSLEARSKPDVCELWV